MDLNIKVHSKLLNRFTANCALLLNVEYNSLRGFDTNNKAFACFCASRILKIDTKILSSFYRIDEAFMLSKFEDFQIHLEVNDKLFITYYEIKNLWKIVIADEA